MVGLSRGYMRENAPFFMYATTRSGAIHTKNAICQKDERRDGSSRYGTRSGEIPFLFSGWRGGFAGMNESGVHRGEAESGGRFEAFVAEVLQRIDEVREAAKAGNETVAGLRSLVEELSATAKETLRIASEGGDGASASTKARKCPVCGAICPTAGSAAAGGAPSKPGKGWRRDAEKTQFLASALKQVLSDPTHNISRTAKRLWGAGCPYTSYRTLENALYSAWRKLLASRNTPSPQSPSA